MKNQNDLICIGVCGFLSLVAAVVMFFMKREPVAPPSPTPVITTAPAYPAGTVSYATSLSGGSSSGAGMGGMGMGRPGGMGGGMGMGGPMGGGMRGGPPGGGGAMGGAGKQRGQNMVGSVSKPGG